MPITNVRMMSIEFSGFLVYCTCRNTGRDLDPPHILLSLPLNPDCPCYLLATWPKIMNEQRVMSNFTFVPLFNTGAVQWRMHKLLGLHKNFIYPTIFIFPGYRNYVPCE